MRDDVAAWFAARTSQAGDWPLDLLMTLKGTTRVSVVLPRAGRGAHGRAHRREHPPRARSRSTGGSPARRRARRRRLGLHRPHRRGRARGRRDRRRARRRAARPPRDQRQGRVDVALAGRDHRRRHRLRRRRPAVVHAGVRHRPARPAAHRRRRPPGEGGLRAPARGGLHRRPRRRRSRRRARRAPAAQPALARLSGIVQPLAGEYAARRSLLEQVPFPCGYGVEIALLVDTLEILGLDAIAQVDLGVRVHRHHDERRLGRMAAEILHTALDRLARRGDLRSDLELGASLTQFDRDGSGFELRHARGGAARATADSAPCRSTPTARPRDGLSACDRRTALAR